MLIALGPGRGFQVQPQQRLRVRGAEVEPPLPHVERPAVQVVGRRVREGAGDPLDHGLGVIDLGVDLARRRVALERLAQLRQRLAGVAHEFQHDQRGDDAGVGPVVVAEVVVAGVLTTEHRAGVGHHRFDERVPDARSDGRAAVLADHLGDRP